MRTWVNLPTHAKMARIMRTTEILQKHPTRSQTQEFEKHGYYDLPGYMREKMPSCMSIESPVNNSKPYKGATRCGRTRSFKALRRATWTRRLHSRIILEMSPHVSLDTWKTGTSPNLERRVNIHSAREGVHRTNRRQRLP